MKEIAKPLSIIMLAAMLVPICFISWFGVTSEYEDSFSLNISYLGGNVDSSSLDAISDGQLTGLELLWLAENSFDSFSEYADAPSSIKDSINEGFEELYGMSYPAFFAVYICSLASIVGLLINIVLNLISYCTNSNKVGWGIIPLVPLAMLYFIVNSTAEINSYMQLYYGGFITLALAIAATIFRKIHLSSHPKSAPYTPISVTPPVYSSESTPSVRHSGRTVTVTPKDTPSQSRVRSTMRKK